MDADHALHHLTELRDAVGDDMTEYVDTLARIVQLNMEITNPMLGAKVTVYLSAPTTSEVRPVDVAPSDILSMGKDLDHVRSTHRFEREGTDMIRWQRWDHPDDPAIIPVEGIVYEANVGEQEETMWDPNREEYRTGDDYPMGTVNTVIPKDWEKALGGRAKKALFSEGYKSATTDRTSLVPRSEDQQKHAYEPGWDAAREFHLDAEVRGEADNS